jgi:hypothetical protein
VYTLTPYSDAIRLTSPIFRSALPFRASEPSLTLFPRDVTPNAHGLAETFVLFDDFDVDADVTRSRLQSCVNRIAR